MVLLNMFIEGYGWISALDKEVTKKDVIPRLDTYVASVECYGGFWEVYNSSGRLIGYFLRDDEI